MGEVTLYNYWRSSSSWRVRIALNLKGIAYEYRAVHLKNGEQNDPAFADINPMGYVPVLEIDGHVLTESLPIIEYLDETRPAPPLLPADPLGRHRARRLAEQVNAGIQPVQNLRVMLKVDADHNVGLQGRIAWGPALD